MLANIKYEGKDYDAIVHADRNGYFHAIDRTTGKLIYARPFVKATSVTGYSADGVPQQDASKYPKAGTTIETCPSFLGGKNWWSVSYDPEKHLAFIPALHACMSLSGKSVNYMEGLPYLGEGFEIKPEPGSKGYGELQAIDVNTGKKVWSHWSKLPWNGGVATTAGGLAFSGSLDGHLYAFDEATGKVLWQSPKLASGIISRSRPWCSGRIDGKEYVASPGGVRWREPDLGWADGQGGGESSARRHLVCVRAEPQLIASSPCPRLRSRRHRENIARAATQPSNLFRIPS